MSEENLLLELMFIQYYFLPGTFSESGILHEPTLIRDNTKILICKDD